MTTQIVEPLVSPTIYLHNQRELAQHETNLACQHAKIRAQASERVLKCMKLYKRCSGSLSIPEMIMLSGFSEGEKKLPCKACMDLLSHQVSGTLP